MSVTVIRRQLATYSLVSQHLDGTTDPISAMKPFFAPIAADWHGHRFDPSAFRTELNNRYGLRISGDVTEIFVQRLHTLGMLRTAGAGKFEWVRDTTINDNGRAAEDKLDTMLRGAEALHESKRDLLTRPFSEELFLSGLQSVLLSQNKPLSSALSAITASGASPSDGEEHDAVVRHHEYFAAEYIRWCSENDKVTFDWLSDLSASTFVSEALIGIRTPPASNDRKTDLSVYLDTPFAMEFLGCSGYSSKEDARFIVDALKSIKVPVYILDHSVEELKGNLKAVLLSKPWERRGPTAAAIIHQEVTETYLNEVLGNPQHFLEDLGVQIIETSKQQHHVCKQSFSDDHHQSLYAKLYSLHENDLARRRDVSSIEWMMYRRKGATSRDVLRSKHILLTRNKHLVRYSQDFSISDCGYERGRAGPAIGARELAGVLWLLMGQQERSGLSQRQLLLSCDRARAAAPEVVAAMLEAVRGVNPRNADLIASAMRRPAYLAIAMDAVANDGGRITEEAIESTLEAVRADLVADERQRASQEIEEEKQRFESESVLQRLVNQSLSSDRDGLAQQISDASARLDAANEACHARTSAASKIVYRIAVVATHIAVMAVAIAAAVVGTDAFDLGWGWKAGAGGFAALVGLYGTHKVAQDALKSLISKLGENAYRNEARKIFASEVEPRYIDRPIID